MDIFELAKFKKIAGGGGDNDDAQSVLDALIDRKITEIESDVSLIGVNAFTACSYLVKADFPFAEKINGSAFYSCGRLKTTNFPRVKIIYASAFALCAELSILDFPSATSIGGAAFQNCAKFSTLILRSEAVCTLGNVSALSSTPISSGTGYIYVPSALIEEYKVATNWSTYAAQFRALEDYTVDGTTTGELDPDKI